MSDANTRAPLETDERRYNYLSRKKTINHSHRKKRRRGFGENPKAHDLPAGAVLQCFPEAIPVARSSPYDQQGEGE